jgi:hypothetical protein
VPAGPEAERDSAASGRREGEGSAPLRIGLPGHRSRDTGFVRNEALLDVCLGMTTGREVYAGREVHVERTESKDL